MYVWFPSGHISGFRVTICGFVEMHLAPPRRKNTVSADFLVKSQETTVSTMVSVWCEVEYPAICPEGFSKRDKLVEEILEEGASRRGCSLKDLIESDGGREERERGRQREEEGERGRETGLR